MEKLSLNTKEKCAEKSFPIYIQSFNHAILKEFGKTNLDLPIFHLFDKVEPISQDFLDKKKVKNMVGIGITEAHATTEIKELCVHNNYGMFYWTLRDDHTEDIPFNMKSYKEVYQYLANLGVDGIIT